MNIQNFIETDQLIHQLAQILAKFNRTYLQANEDDSHTTITYDDLNHRLLSNWSEKIEHGSYMLVFDLITFRFNLINDRIETQFSVSIFDKNYLQIEQEIKEKLEMKSISVTNFSNDMHYVIPNYSFVSEPINKIEPLAISNWCAFRILANQICNKISNHFNKVTKPKIWPHHFDTGIYLTINDSFGIGFGLAMKDDLIDEPYFYYSAYKSEDSVFIDENLPELTSGEWFTGEFFKGAILNISDSDEEQLTQFVEEVTNTYFG